MKIKIKKKFILETATLRRGIGNQAGGAPSPSSATSCGEEESRGISRKSGGKKRVGITAKRQHPTALFRPFLNGESRRVFPPFLDPALTNSRGATVELRRQTHMTQAIAGYERAITVKVRQENGHGKL